MAKPDKKSVEPAQQSAQDDVTELEPDFSLKKKIGKDVALKDVFTKESMQESQKVINNTRKDFLKWVENDLKTLENALNTAQADPASASDSVSAISRAAFSIKAQAGTFGFDLGSAVAKSLYDFCENHYTDNPKHLLIIRKHVDTLNTIFHQKVEGDGGKTGTALFKQLGELIDTFTDNQT